MSRKRAKGEGTIVLRKDSRYEGKLSFGGDNGKRVRKTVYGKSRTEVAKKLRALRSTFSLLQTDLRLGEYLDLWLQDGISRWEPQTYRSYASWLLHVRHYLGNRKIVDLTSSEVKSWLRQLEAAGVGATTRKRALSTLRSALKALVDEEQLQRNPCNSVRGPRVQRKDFHVPEPAEVRKLLDTAEPFWVCVLLLVGFSTTMREGEIFALYWSQFDLKKKNLNVNKSLAVGWNGKLERKTTKNKHSRRTIFLPLVTVDALTELKQRQMEEGYDGPWIFPDSDGGPLRKSNFIRREYASALLRAGLPYFRFYALRHAGNSLLISQGEDALSIAKRMGHADTRMTFDTYGHLFEGSGQRSAASMERGLDEYGITINKHREV